MPASARLAHDADPGAIWYQFIKYTPLVPQPCFATAVFAAAATLLFTAPSLARPVRTFGTGGAPLHYLVLGDSTAAGVGGDYEQGIAIATARELGRSNAVTMKNLAVSGARMKDVLAQQLPVAETMRPDVVLLSAGANDVTHLTCIRSMRRSLREIVQRLRVVNPSVTIIITGSPDMGAPPRIPRLLRGIAGRRTEQANRMFRAEGEELHLTFAPIAAMTGPLFRRDPSHFAADRFHPNDRGYAAWIPVLNQAIDKATR